MRSHLKSEVQDLVWAVVDEYATESQIRRLEQLILTSEEARRTYVTCMQMHADLCYLLGGTKFNCPSPRRFAGRRPRRPRRLYRQRRR